MKKPITCLQVYAGPEIQLVLNSSSVLRYGCSKYTSLGYAVLCVDGRGSAHRGAAFSNASIRNRLGTVEMKDQVGVFFGVLFRVFFRKCSTAWF